MNLKKLKPTTDGFVPDQSTPDVTNVEVSAETKVAAKTPIEKGSLTDAKDKPAPVKAKKDKKPKIEKKDMTKLPDGFTYSLLSRVRNAFKEEERNALEVGHDVLDMVDGRGQAQKISEVYRGLGIKYGGAAYVASVKTAAIKVLVRKEREAKVEAKAETVVAAQA